jgi:EGF-like domain
VIIDHCLASSRGLSAGGPCLNGATCVSVANPPLGGANFVCRCPPAFQGRLCQHARPRDDSAYANDNGNAVGSAGPEAGDPSECTARTCLNGGTCVEEKTWGSTPVAKCVCSTGYTGVDCGRKLTNVISEHGTPDEGPHLVFVSATSSAAGVVHPPTLSNVTTAAEAETTVGMSELWPAAIGQHTVIIIIAVVASSVFVSAVTITTIVVTFRVCRRRKSAGGDVVDNSDDDVIPTSTSRHIDITCANNVALMSPPSTKVGKASDHNLAQRIYQLPDDVRVKNVLYT